MLKLSNCYNITWDYYRIGVNGWLMVGNFIRLYLSITQNSVNKYMLWLLNTIIVLIACITRKVHSLALGYQSVALI